ncbi:transcription repressor NadR [Colibacter massiliensis]|uniref:transcription repressor NadR n=1 Tax=Colibacter massiliensis TaxID=1852379 RepID=UPI003F8EF35A
MNTSKRRLRIMELLSRANTPLTGSSLADICHVTRQIIVSDIARLRAEGTPVISTPQGYQLLRRHVSGIKRTIVCKHGQAETERELLTIIKNGGTVHNVTVEHGVYGNLEGSLHLTSENDVNRYMKRMKNTNAAVLSSISGGIHTHLIEAPTAEIMERIIKALEKEGFLYS